VRGVKMVEARVRDSGIGISDVEKVGKLFGNLSI
jgi:hypothetical protein